MIFRRTSDNMSEKQGTRHLHVGIQVIASSDDLHEDKERPERESDDSIYEAPIKGTVRSVEYQSDPSETARRNNAHAADEGTAHPADEQHFLRAIVWRRGHQNVQFFGSFFSRLSVVHNL